MEKILLAVNAAEININTLDFACYIAKLTHSKITGVFLENPQGAEAPLSKQLHSVPVTAEAGLPASEVYEKQYEGSIQQFKEACCNRGVNCSIHLDYGVPVTEIINESRFADLLIADAGMSFEDKAEGTPSRFIKEVLAKSECPVVIAPFTFNGIDEILFAYDGSPSSVFAVKQFTYLFPELTDKKITILQVDENEGLPVIEKEKMGELLQMHYSSIGFRALHGKAGNELFNHLLGRKNVFVVMGAFGRTLLSGFFRRSTAELVIKTVNLPVFIAHH